MDSSACDSCGWSDMPQIVKEWPEDGDKDLLVPAPYDRLYDLYVMAQVDFLNRESDNYNNSVLAYNTALDEWQKNYHRRHMPLGAGAVTNLW